MSVIKFLPLDLGSALLAGFFQVTFDRLMPHSLAQIFIRDKDVRLNLNKWFTKVAIIQAVLDDAEEKQWTNVAIKMWLDDLRDFFYDLEDMLDECNTKLLARTVNVKSGTNLISIAREAVKELVTNKEAMSDSGLMYERLVKLCDGRNLLGLIETTAGGTSTAVWQRPPSTCVPTETTVYGRDEDRCKIFDMMKIKSSDANFHVISIVGMAGVGKTTLAQTVYNCWEETTFDRKAWVCVSHDFDILTISMAILESFTHLPCHLKNLNEVQVQLRQVINNSKFLLVLDDVWSKSYDLWEILRSPFAAGAQGSKIIVTTRSVDVALTIGGPSDCYHLKLLSDEDCWRVFEKHACENRDVGAYSNLESFREKVVRKCQGLPLAARTLGGLLRSKESNDEWNDVLNSKIWELPKESNILPVLKLSYYHLPSHLKRCFAHCAILPKNYEFEENELVLYWMVEDLILPSESNKQLEDIGHEYFQDLLSRSIFQKSSGDASKFVMHNLINDLAQWVAGETSFKLEDELETHQYEKRIHRARHSSYICGKFDRKNKFEVFDGVHHLRTFLPVLTQNADCYISDAVLRDLPKFEKLRVLSLQRYCITNLPLDFKKHLRYLRYLNLSYTLIKSLPDSITSLYNLQILLLRNCSRLSKLPSNVETLINLRHLDIQGAVLIGEMPLGMQELEKIQTLSDFIVSNSSCPSSSGQLKDLKNLKFLRGELCISQLQKLAELRDAILSDKEKLEVLILEWGSQFISQKREKEKDVLDMLQPHENLKKITIRHYGGSEFPSWVGDPCFSSITVLRLEDCKNCRSLPPLGLLGSLKDLTITGMTELSKIGPEFCGKGCSKPFRALETLCLENLRTWNEWNPVENIGPESFSSLRELSIKRCPEVHGRLPEHLPSLQKLVIQQCANLKISFSSIPDLCDIEIDGCQMTGSTNAIDFVLRKFMSLSNISGDENWFMEMFQKVEHLKVNNCSCLVESFPRNCLRKLEVENCSLLTSLQSIMEHSTCLDCLKIKDCELPNSIARGQSLSMLKKLEIHNCQNLHCLLEADHIRASRLKHLCISECQSLATLSSSGRLPEALQYLEIRDCLELTTLGELPEALHHLQIWDCQNLQNLGQLPARLEHVEIKKCNNLTSLSGGELPASLKHLHIEECQMITTLSSVGHLPASLEHLNIDSCSFTSVPGPLPRGLKQLVITSCGNLSSIPEGLQNLSNLQEFDISNCPSLVSFPQGGLPSSSLTILVISSCVNLQALPMSMHRLTSLRKLVLSKCLNITALPDGGFPTKITSLTIDDHKIYSLLTQWGLYKFTSLRELELIGCSNALSSIPTEEVELMLPTSLTHLTLSRFPQLKSLSPGFTRLTSLEYLCISDCQKMADFPNEGLPPSLLQLRIIRCPKLKSYCEKYTGRHWDNIVDIPFVEIED